MGNMINNDYTPNLEYFKLNDDGNYTCDIFYGYDTYGNLILTEFLKYDPLDCSWSKVIYVTVESNSYYYEIEVDNIISYILLGHYIEKGKENF